MRRFFFNLLILLTAFRGVVGDVMAFEMSAGMVQHAGVSVTATKFIASGPESTIPNDHSSSEKHAGMPCHGASEDESSQAASHDCNACQVCHSPVLQRACFCASLVQAPAAYTLREDHAWLSADLALLQKPPVS